MPYGAFARPLPVLATPSSSLPQGVRIGAHIVPVRLAEMDCHARARAASVSLRSVEMRENQATECIFFKKQQVLE